MRFGADSSRVRWKSKHLRGDYVSVRVNRDFGDVVSWIEAGEKDREVGATSGFFL